MKSIGLTLAAAIGLAALPSLAAAQAAADSACGWNARCSAPGATLSVVEVARAAKGGRGTEVTYRVSARGLPAGPAYTLWMRRVDGAAQWIVAGYAADPSGGLRCADRAAFAELAKQAGNGWCPIPLDSITFGLNSMVPGESVDFALRAHDGSAGAYTRVVPHPVQSSADGCTLSMVVTDPAFKSVLVSGSGFVPGEQVRTVSTSGKESVDGSATVGADGSLTPAIVMPAVKGSGRGGEAAYEVIGSKCTVRLPYSWGNKLKAI